MKQLYQIRAYGGSYDDAWERVQYVTDDLEKGQAYCDKMNAFRDVVISAKEQFYAHTRQWQIDNPRPVMRELKPVPIPKWDSTTKVTKEMRDERAKLEELNRADNADACKPMYDWAQASYQEGENFKLTLSEEIRQGLKENWDDTNWEIDPVEWLE